MKLPITHTASATKVVVLMGGWSCEREVSLVSGQGVAASLEHQGYMVHSYDMTRDLQALLIFLQKISPDVVFISLHGRGGEDGQIQAVLEILQIPFTHSGVLACAIAMDKRITKTLCQSQGIRVPFGRLYSFEDVREIHPLPFPYVIKPGHEGSSMGVHLFFEGDAPLGKRMSTWDFEGPILVESYIPGREISVGILGHQPLPVTELIPAKGFYDYTAKYTDGKTLHQVPALLPCHITQQAQEWALRAHTLLGCEGISRSDFRYQEETDELYFLELNTHPGFTKLSILPEEAAVIGITYDQIVAWLVEDALCRAV